MASSPPFQVEDQTDEDFFDNLVDEDFRSTTITDNSPPKSIQGNDPDDVRAFANLSMGEDSGGEGGFDKSKIENDALDENVLSDSNVLAEVENNSKGMAIDNVVQSSSEKHGNTIDSDSIRTSRVSAAVVKEVGWSSFYADSEENDKNHGFGSYSDLFGEFVDKQSAGSNEAKIVSGNEGCESTVVDNSANPDQHQGGQAHDTNGQYPSNSEYWNNMYPGWNFDPNTGEWYQVESYESNSATGKSEVNYMQQSAQSVAGTMTETDTSQTISSWNQVMQGNNGYPEHMIFDPQYPGWYYDRITQEWCSLESYNMSAVQSTAFQKQNDPASTSAYSHQSNGMSVEHGQANNYASQVQNGFNQHNKPTDSFGIYSHQGFNLWQPKAISTTAAFPAYNGNKQMQNSYGALVSSENHFDQQESYNNISSVLSTEKTRQGHCEANRFMGTQNIVPRNFSPSFDQTNVKQQHEEVHYSDYYGDSQKQGNFGQQSFQSSQQFNHAPNVGQSSAGRPPHALVTFGFGGKLIVMKETTSLKSSYGVQNSAGGTIFVLNLMEVVTVSNDASSIRAPTCDYVRALCHQSFPGPLVGGSAGSKELSKWIDERISNCGSHDMDFKKGEVLKVLLSLLKIACQHYGKLRSPFGTDIAMKENDNNPENAVAKLFTSAKRNGSQHSQYGAINQCLLNFPAEGQVRATASEVQNLLVSGRKVEALQCAQEGQLWGPALVLASQLGEQFYVDTVKQMALRQLVAGSPLRTLCLLIAGQPEDVFSADTVANGGLPKLVNTCQQPGQLHSGANSMLDDWEENLAVVTANRTKNDELVITHLGDCLWRERSEITAAHICYLVAEAKIESYSDSSRMCLIGADHWKYPRTYACPEAIQRTEFYEYTQVLGNSQSTLLPFQPYKLIYAHMLAELGKVSDSLKYCQAVLKSLKTGRAPEVETWKQLVTSLEERIKTHQQGGYASNLAPAKIVGKLLNFFDSTARVVGGLPPPASTTLQETAQMGPRVSASQSTMAMSSLMPHSMEPISDWAADGNKKTRPNRSVSEPDFSRSPRQVDSSNKTISQGKAGLSSRFARFGFGSQLLQKTVGYVLKPRSDRQAKLGESNKFYYDEKLKRWVEEGANPPAEEVVLPPPTTTALFQNGSPNYNLKSVLKNDGSPMDRSPKKHRSPTPSEASGIPPIPTGSNHSSARARTGVRARYVDTFHKGGGNSFQSPSFQSVKPVGPTTTKFFIPATPSSEQTMEPIAENIQEVLPPNGNSLASTTIHSQMQTPPPLSMNMMQRYPSMNNMSNQVSTSNGNEPQSSHSRRTVSWGGWEELYSPPNTGETKPLGEVLGLSPPSSSVNLMTTRTNGGSFRDELHEVEL